MLNLSNIEIILASGSSRRNKILKKLFKSFSIQIPQVEERTYESAAKTVSFNAKLKCGKIAKNNESALIIAADTVVSFNDKILEKPKTYEHATEMLKVLCGQTHQVLTSVALSYNTKSCSFTEISNVTFKVLKEADIVKYHSLVNPLDKAGAYNIDEYGDIIIEKFEGEYENIMGLPVKSLIKHINKLI